RVITRDSRDILLRGGHIRDDLFDRPPAACEPAERQRSAQEHDHLAPRHPFGRLRGALRELPLECRAVFGEVLDLCEASPVGAAHPWHPEHSVGRLTGRLPTCDASSRASRGGFHFILVTSETGRLL